MLYHWLESREAREVVKTPCESLSKGDTIKKSWAVLIQILSGPVNI